MNLVTIESSLFTLSSWPRNSKRTILPTSPQAIEDASPSLFEPPASLMAYAFTVSNVSFQPLIMPTSPMPSHIDSRVPCTPSYVSCNFCRYSFSIDFFLSRYSFSISFSLASLYALKVSSSLFLRPSTNLTADMPLLSAISLFLSVSRLRANSSSSGPIILIATSLWYPARSISVAFHGTARISSDSVLACCIALTAPVPDSTRVLRSSNISVQYFMSFNDASCLP